ncbi:MAG TPA: hypothetical protein VF550_08780, partial [Polyangia bacterium]
MSEAPTTAESRQPESVRSPCEVLTGPDGSRGSTPSTAPSLPALRWWHFLLIAVVYLYAFPFFDKMRSANEVPRILMTRAMVDHGVLYIDQVAGDLGEFADTSNAPDGHTYPNKAPGPSLLAVPVYAVSKLLGVRSLRGVTWAFRIVVVTIPSLLFLPLFYRISQRFTADESARRFALVAFAFASQAFPYALLFMSHAPATISVGTAFGSAIALVRGEAGRRGWSAILVGFASAMGVMMDYQAVMAASVIGLFVLLCAPHRIRNLVLMIVGAMPPAVVLLSYHKLAFGAFFKTGYDFAIDPSTNSGFMGIIGFNKAAITSTFVLPSNGILVLAPWVLFAVLGLVATIAQREARLHRGAEAVACAVIATVYLLFLCSLLPYMARGGWCVGPRYMTVAMPFIAWLAAAGIEVARRNRVTNVLALAMVVASATIFVVGGTTFPHWPDPLLNPLYDLVFPLLGRGYAVHSLGTAVGLRGIYAILPLYLFAFLLITWLLGLLQVRALPKLAMVCALAGLFVFGQS